MSNFSPPDVLEVEAEFIAALGILMAMVEEHYVLQGFTFLEIERLISNTFHIGYIEGYKRSKGLAVNTPDII